MRPSNILKVDGILVFLPVAFSQQKMFYGNMVEQALQLKENSYVSLYYFIIQLTENVLQQSGIFYEN